MVRVRQGNWGLLHFWRKAVRGDEGAITSAAGEGGQECDMVAIADGGVPVDKFIINGGLGDMSSQRNFFVGLNFVEELARGFGFRLIGVHLRAAVGTEEGVVTDGDVFHARG